MNKKRYDYLKKVMHLYRHDIGQLAHDIKSIAAAMKTQDAMQSHGEVKKEYAEAPIILEVKNASKVYKLGKQKVHALDDVNLAVHQGEIVAIIGKSGSGKSTLMHMIGGLDKATKGQVLVDGKDVTKMSDGALSKYRGRKIGFVFQSFYLQPFLSVQDNIEVPAMFARTKRKARRAVSSELAGHVDMSERLKHYPKELSGGQVQRTAVARALVNSPKILLADEPTGNLDSENGESVFELFEKVRREQGVTVVIVTHDHDLAQKADRIIELRDGKVVV